MFLVFSREREENNCNQNARVKARAVYVVVDCDSYHSFVTVWEKVLKEPKPKALPLPKGAPRAGGWDCCV